VVKSKRIRWTRCVEHIIKMINMQKFQNEKFEGITPLVRGWCSWENCITDWCLKGRVVSVDRILLTWHSEPTSSCEHGFRNGRGIVWSNERLLAYVKTTVVHGGVRWHWDRERSSTDGMDEAFKTFHLLPSAVFPSYCSGLYQPAQRAFLWMLSHTFHFQHLCEKKGEGECGKLHWRRSRKYRPRYRGVRIVGNRSVVSVHLV
jgi:hypothetical protein